MLVKEGIIVDISVIELIENVLVTCYISLVLIFEVGVDKGQNYRYRDLYRLYSNEGSSQKRRNGRRGYTVGCLVLKNVFVSL